MRLKASGADTVFVYTYEEDIGRFLPQVKAMGIDKMMRIIGQETLPSEDTIRLAREGANGVMGSVEISCGAEAYKPICEKYQKQYGEIPDFNCLKYYVGAHVFNAVMKEIKVFDQQKFRDYLHNRTFCVKDYPGIRNSIHYDEKGDIDWATYVVKIQNQQLVVSDNVPPLHPEWFEKCKK